MIEKLKNFLKQKEQHNESMQKLLELEKANK